MYFFQRILHTIKHAAFDTIEDRVGKTVEKGPMLKAPNGAVYQPLNANDFTMDLAGVRVPVETSLDHRWQRFREEERMRRRAFDRQQLELRMMNSQSLLDSHQVAERWNGVMEGVTTNTDSAFVQSQYVDLNNQWNHHLQNYYDHDQAVLAKLKMIEEDYGVAEGGELVIPSGFHEKRSRNSLEDHSYLNTAICPECENTFMIGLKDHLVVCGECKTEFEVPDRATEGTKKSATSTNFTYALSGTFPDASTPSLMNASSYSAGAIAGGGGGGIAGNTTALGSNRVNTAMGNLVTAAGNSGGAITPGVQGENHFLADAIAEADNVSLPEQHFNRVYIDELAQLDSRLIAQESFDPPLVSTNDSELIITTRASL